MGSESFLLFFCLFFVFSITPIILPFGRYFYGMLISSWLLSLFIFVQNIYFPHKNSYGSSVLFGLLLLLACFIPFSFSSTVRMIYHRYRRHKEREFSIRETLLLIVSAFVLLLQITVSISII